jgi:hypothetical protein
MTELTVGEPLRSAIEVAVKERTAMRIRTPIVRANLMKVLRQWKAEQQQR